MRLATAVLCVALLTPALARADSAGTTSRHTLEGSEVSIYNIAGAMEVVSGTGSSVVVEVTPQGRDASRLSVKETTDGGVRTLRVIYPDDHIVYPDYGYGSTSWVDSESYFGTSGHRIRVTGSGSGLEAHADLRVTVPKGKKVDLHLVVGSASITGADADLSFESASASVRIEKASGALDVSVGSGSVRVAGMKGEVSVQAGSGDVKVNGVEGSVKVETGSGEIELSEVGGEKIEASAGSGAVTGTSLRASELKAEAGSGEVTLDGATAKMLSVDTGSGSIHVRLLDSVDDLKMDAGSGSVTLEVTDALNAKFRIECPQKRIHIGFPVQIEEQNEDVTVGVIGSGGGRISIDAGSGGVRLDRR